MVQVLCSVKSPGKALEEMRRVLKDRGRLLFIEHVIASSNKPGLQLAQRLLDPLQQFASDGCHLVRDTLPLVRSPAIPYFDNTSCCCSGMRIARTFVVLPTAAVF